MSSKAWQYWQTINALAVSAPLKLEAWIPAILPVFSFDLVCKFDKLLDYLSVSELYVSKDRGFIINRPLVRSRSP